MAKWKIEITIECIDYDSIDAYAEFQINRTWNIIYFALHEVHENETAKKKKQRN